MSDDLLTPGELAVMLGMSVRTLANWRSTGKGPPYLKIGVEPPEGHQDRQGQIPTSSRGKVGIGAQVSKDGGEMKNGMFVPVTRIQSSPNVTSDGKARVDTGKPTLTQQGIDMDKFIRENHALIERLRKGTN